MLEMTREGLSRVAEQRSNVGGCQLLGVFSLCEEQKVSLASSKVSP